MKLRVLLTIFPVSKGSIQQYPIKLGGQYLVVSGQSTSSSVVLDHLLTRVVKSQYADGALLLFCALSMNPRPRTQYAGIKGSFQLWK